MPARNRAMGSMETKPKHLIDAIESDRTCPFRQPLVSDLIRLSATTAGIQWITGYELYLH